MELLNLVLLDYRKSAKECSRRLEFEENTNKLAALQGELSACKQFLDTFKNSFSSSSIYDAWDIDDQNMPNLEKVTDKQIALLEKQRIAIEKDEAWGNFQEILDRSRAQKKEWLFSSAEKGRDLVHTHGWRDGIRKHSNFFDSVAREYEYRVDQNGLFPEDLNIDDDEPEVLLLEDSSTFYLDDNSHAQIIDVEFEEMPEETETEEGQEGTDDTEN